MRFDLSKKQNWILLFIFAFISYFISSLLINFITIKSILLEVPGFFSIFWFLLWIFDKYIWKWEIFKILKIIEFPNLEGKYKGNFISSWKNPKTGKEYQSDIELNIKQTASNISIQGIFNQSKSISTQASFGFNDIEQKICLYYFFKNKPLRNAINTMKQHEWSAILCYDEKNKKLEWEYYSGRDRNNYWYIEVYKIE